MRKILDYKLIISGDPLSHEKAINKLLKEGYSFRGSIQLLPPQYHEDLYSCLISEMILFEK